MADKMVSFFRGDRGGGRAKMRHTLDRTQRER